MQRARQKAIVSESHGAEKSLGAMQEPGFNSFDVQEVSVHSHATLERVDWSIASIQYGDSSLLRARRAAS